MVPWKNIVRDLGKKLFRYFCTSFPSHLADDLVQETLIRLYRNVTDGSYITTQGSMTAYAFGIAHKVRLEKIKSYARDERPIATSEQIPGHSCPEKHFLLGEQQARLRQAIGLLKLEEQNIVTLLIEKDLKLSEIALILSLPLNTVKSHLHRAKENLRNHLQEKDDERSRSGT